MNELAGQIEAFLLERGGWVPARAICDRFGIMDTRALRAVGDKPSLCADFAISHTRWGFKHIQFATEREAVHAYQARRKHGISELVSARRMIRRWRNAPASRPMTPPSMDRGGQLQLLEVGGTVNGRCQ